MIKTKYKYSVCQGDIDPLLTGHGKEEEAFYARMNEYAAVAALMEAENSEKDEEVCGYLISRVKIIFYFNLKLNFYSTKISVRRKLKLF